MNDNLVIGMAWKYQIKDVFIFVESWKKHCNSDLILVVNSDAEDSFINYLEKSGVLIYDFIFQESKIPNIFRYFAFQSILNNLNYKKCFITDVKDVVFQDNIFLYSENELDFFMESIIFNHYSKFNENYNFNTYEVFYGIEKALNLCSKTVSCCGTVLGYKKYIELYLNTMVEQFSNKNLNIFGLDSAVHHYIVHNDIIISTKNKNGNGVLTLQETSKDKIKTVNNNKVLFDNKFPFVLHQYDRHENLKLMFNDLYNYEKSISNT
jgi:hypothetical protein